MCNNGIEDARIARYVNNSREFLKYWVIWEASRYCMLSRLRTPLGGPQQVNFIFVIVVVGT